VKAPRRKERCNRKKPAEQGGVVESLDRGMMTKVNVRGGGEKTREGEKELDSRVCTKCFSDYL